MNERNYRGNIRDLFTFTWEVDGIEEELGEENRFLPARYEEDDIENNDDTRRQQCLSFFKDFNFINN